MHDISCQESVLYALGRDAILSSLAALSDIVYRTCTIRVIPSNRVDATCTGAKKPVCNGETGEEVRI